MLDQEIKYYREHLGEWLTQYPQRFVLVKGNELVGTFDTQEQALTEGVRRFGLSSFLIRRVQEHQDEIRIPALTLGLLNGNSTHSVS
jgi:hypothetical protein